MFAKQQKILAKVLQKKNDSVLMFSNGLSVDLKNMDALINSPQKNINGHPASLFYMKEGQLEEKMFSGDIMDTSALLILGDNGSWSSVLADRRLIRSLMFRLYYLKGQGLKYFKPFSEHNDVISNNRVTVFELNQEPLNERSSSVIEV